jgi:hypothetical protein
LIFHLTFSATVTALQEFGEKGVPEAVGLAEFVNKMGAQTGLFGDEAKKEGEEGEAGEGAKAEGEGEETKSTTPSSSSSSSSTSSPLFS